VARKQPKCLVNEVRDGHFIRAWKEGRQEIVVQVWEGTEPTGEPAGDWAMPALLGVTACIAQAILQTKDDLKQKSGR